MSIEDFESNVLCIPLFRSFIIHTEALISNLDHIFRRNGLDMICLQQSLVKSLKEIKEEGKVKLYSLFIHNYFKKTCIAYLKIIHLPVPLVFKYHV